MFSGAIQPGHARKRSFAEQRPTECLSNAQKNSHPLSFERTASIGQALGYFQGKCNVNV